MAALGATSLARYVAKSLPHNVDPQLKSSTDALAIACHAGMLAVGFKLIGLGEDHRLTNPSTSEDTQRLPAEWNASATVDFRYSHPQSSMQYLLRVSRLGSKVAIQGIGLGHDKVVTFDVHAADYVSESSLPAKPSAAAASEEDAQHAISSIFISPSRLTDFGSLLKLNIIQKLVPGLQKEGYEDASTTAATSSSQGQNVPHPRDPIHDPPAYDPLRDGPQNPVPAQPHPLVDPSIGPRPQRPIPAGDFPPPGFEDPYDIHRPRGGMRPGGMGGMAPGYGERDLYPPGMSPHDPLRVGGVGGGGGGMFMDMRDLDRSERPDFDPQIPPGARHDPVGPGGGPGRGAPYDPLSGDRGPPRRGGGGFGGMPGAPPNPFQGFGSDDFI